MARQGRAQAESRTRQTQDARLQYLTRNPEFRSAVDSLIQLRDDTLPERSGPLTEERIEAVQVFLAKAEDLAGEWCLPWDMFNIRSWRGWYGDQDPKERIPAAVSLSNFPVEAWTNLLPGHTATTYESWASAPRDTRYLNLRVDLEHSADTLLPLIEQALSQYSKAHRKGKRRRLDQLPIHLRVFDLAEAGHSFRTIAREVKKPITTVKSTFLVARRNVYGSRGPSKSKLPLTGFDFEGHVRGCETCRSAEAFQHMCMRARRYALQD